MARAPRGPRPPVVTETPESVAPAADVQIDAHGAIEILDGPPVEALYEPYDGRWMKCRKPFKLNGQRYRKGDDVPVDMIPRVDSWIHTGFIEEKAS